MVFGLIVMIGLFPLACVMIAPSGKQVTHFMSLSSKPIILNYHIPLLVGWLGRKRHNLGH